MSSPADLDWDYVIVGAGLAGAVLANRLSADPAVRVLLLETAPRSRLDQRLWTEPETELEGRRLSWTLACLQDGTRLAGGSSYTRGQAEDYDEWAARGNAGWEFAAVLPHFRRSEDSWRGEGPFHGVGGPVAVLAPRQPHPVSRDFIAAAHERGLRTHVDFNGPRQDGVAFYDRAQDDGRGGSAAAAAFLRPAGTRRNLRVLAGVRALRVVFEGVRAVGVECLRGGRVQRLRATREVLVCAGAVGSPTLLLHSGVGDALQLRALGIGVVANLPGVGANLQDALEIGVAWRHPDGALDGPGALKAIADALSRLLVRDGRAVAEATQAGGFLVSALAADGRPDLQLQCLPVSGARTQWAGPGNAAFVLHASALRPRSRGALRLASADPAVPPRIAPHYLGEREDLDVLIEGVHLARDFGTARALRAWRGEELVPGPGHDTRRALIEFIRRRADSHSGPVGTCRMGPAGEAGTVVDASLRVHGVEALRVVDASVMPQLVSGNPMACTMMIGERAADLLLRGRA